MSNSILSNNLNNTINDQKTSPLLNMYREIKRSSNPMQAMEIMFANNPQYQNVMNYINQNGGDAKTAFYNMAAQMNVDPNTVLSQLR